MTLTLTTIVFAAVGAVAFFLCLLLLRHASWRGALMRGTALWLLIGLAAASLMFAGALHRWHPVMANEAVKTVIITEVGTDAWRVSVQYPGGGAPRTHQLTSEFLEVRGHLLAFDGLLFEIGFPAMAYYGEPVAGGWFNVEQGLAQATEPQGEDFMTSYQQWFRAVARWLPMVRVEEPLPAYLPLADQAVFDIVVSGHRLEAVPVNDSAEEAWQAWVEE